MKTTYAQNLKIEGMKNVYQCPMKCEGDKTYDAPANCPVCNMKLAPVTEQSSQGHHHCC